MANLNSIKNTSHENTQRAEEQAKANGNQQWGEGRQMPQAGEGKILLETSPTETCWLGDPQMSKGVGLGRGGNKETQGGIVSLTGERVGVRPN